MPKSVNGRRKNFSTGFDERSRKRAQLIEKAKGKASELGANAILGMGLETSQSAGVVGPANPGQWYERVEMVLCGTAVKY